MCYLLIIQTRMYHDIKLKQNSFSFDESCGGVKYMIFM